MILQESSSKQLGILKEFRLQQVGFCKRQQTAWDFARIFLKTACDFAEI